MNPLLLGGILRNFYDSFDMTKFETRLKTQKIIYLMQSKGMNLGYEFALYLYGPYSTELTRDAFQITDLVPNFSQVDKVVPSEKKEEFTRFIGELEINSRKDNSVWLEIAATYLFFKKLGETSEEVIIKRMKEKRKDFEISDIEIRKIISEVKNGGFFI